MTHQKNQRERKREKHSHQQHGMGRGGQPYTDFCCRGKVSDPSSVDCGRRASERRRTPFLIVAGCPLAQADKRETSDTFFSLWQAVRWRRRTIERRRKPFLIVVGCPLAKADKRETSDAFSHCGRLSGGEMHQTSSISMTCLWRPGGLSHTKSPPPPIRS